MNYIPWAVEDLEMLLCGQGFYNNTTGYDLLLLCPMH